jgi:predicted nuclease of predicted toxin-antitoxin system
VAKLLIDECLHTSLLKLAHEASHTADHVNYLGLGSSKDWDLMKLILDRDYTFVTNNRTDFLALYGRTQVHAGLVIIVPNVTPTLQRELFQAALSFIGERGLINAVVEIEYHDGKEIECRQYPMPPE